MPDLPKQHYGDAGRASGPTPGAGSARFFGWLRSLGITRRAGWVGGVCGGVAASLGIDPIIVRGIAVVVAVLGGPAFLLYAAAWLLLPDAHGDIHLERLIRGHFDPPVIAIIVIVLFSLLPFAQGFWWAGAQFWGGLSWFSSAGRVLWTLLVIALIVGVIVWAARSGRIPPAPPRSTPPASPTDAGGGAASSAFASAAPASAHAEGPAATDQTTTGQTAPDSAPGASTANAPESDLADWRARQEAWKTDYAAWTAQRNDERAIRQQRSAEMRAQAQALAAEAEEARRRRRAANPRTSAAYVFISLGIALVGGGVAAALALVGSGRDFALAIALATATGLIGLAIATAGILRRRSGFLTFVSVVLIAATLAAALPRLHQFVLLPIASYSNPHDLKVYQPVGATRLYYDGSGTDDGDIVQGAGTVTVLLQNGVSARVEVVQHAPNSTFDAVRVDAAGDAREVESEKGGAAVAHTYVIGDGSPSVDLHIDQGLGTIRVEYHPSTNG